MADTTSVNSNEQKTNYQPILLILLLLSLIGNAYLIFSNKKLETSTTTTIENLEVEKADLQTEFDNMIAELDDYKEENIELDSTLVNMESEIEAQKQEIKNLLGKGNATRQELSQAKNLIESLRIISKDYKVKLDQLVAENAYLNQENTGLKDEVVKKTDTIQQLEGEKQELATKTTILAEQKDLLQKVVKRGSVMMLNNVSATGVKVRNNGKEVETNNDKQTEKIRVCFDVMPNPIADQGPKDILARIIGPGGTTLAMSGSTVFKNTESGDETQYSTKTVIAFNGDREKHCMYWTQNTPFSKGLYTTELYHDGYWIGQTNFELK
ncbi:MAG: hypothetical protein R3E32_01015 [Chitinophagales bacterium]